jgi:hypothetical protein
MGAVSVSNVEALMKLAMKLVGRVLSRPFSRPASAGEVVALYAGDRVSAVPAAERDAAPRVRRCTGCGRCDHLADFGPAPSLLVLRLAREGQDAAAAMDAARRLQPIAQAIEVACPERVDVPAMLASVERRAALTRQ